MHFTALAITAILAFASVVQPAPINSARTIPSTNDIIPDPHSINGKYGVEAETRSGRIARAVLDTDDVIPDPHSINGIYKSSSATHF